MIDKLNADHEKLRSIMTDFQDMLLASAPCDAKALAHVRWELGSAVMQNLAFEERYVYSKLAATQNPRMMALMAVSAAALKTLFGEYTSHVDTWTPARVESDWAAYRMSAQALLANLGARMEWEEREIFPLVRLGECAGDGTPEAISENWARNAFAIKDRIRAGI